MCKKQVISTGVAFAMSLSLLQPLLQPALAQGDPIPGGGPAITPTQAPTQVQTQQPNSLQTLFQNIQQQQQIQNLFNPSQFPAFIQSNPSISPLDQRSGLDQNANSVNQTNKPQSSLGVTQGTPKIGGSSLLNNPLLTQKNLGFELANRFGGPTASSLFDLLFVASNGQSVVPPAQLDRIPTSVLYGALLGLARANNLPISDSLLSLLESLKSNPTTFDLLRPTLLQLVNGIFSGTMSRQTMLSALSFLTNPQVMNGFVGGVQTATSVGKGASQAELFKQIADQVKQASIGITPSVKPTLTLSPAKSIFGSLNTLSSITQNIALNNALQAFAAALNTAMKPSTTTSATSNTSQSQSASTPQTSVTVLDPSRVPTNLNTPITTLTTTTTTTTTSSAPSEKPTPINTVNSTVQITNVTPANTSTTTSSNPRPVPTVTITPISSTNQNSTTPTTNTTNTAVTGTTGGIQGIGSSLHPTSIQGMDLETLMMQIQSNRSNLLETQLADKMQTMKATNDQMVKLNEQLGDLNKQRADAVAMHDTAKTNQLDTQINQVKDQINTLASTQQIDMLRMQSLTNKRNEAFELMTNFMKKMADSRSSILGNMR